MKAKYDKEVDVLYITFSENEIVESDEDKPGIILDYDKSIESILDLPKGFEAYREDIGDKWQITKSI